MFVTTKHTKKSTYFVSFRVFRGLNKMAEVRIISGLTKCLPLVLDSRIKADLLFDIRSESLERRSVNRGLYGMQFIAGIAFVADCFE